MNVIKVRFSIMTAPGLNQEPSASILHVSHPVKLEAATRKWAHLGNTLINVTASLRWRQHDSVITLYNYLPRLHYWKAMDIADRFMGER